MNTKENNMKHRLNAYSEKTKNWVSSVLIKLESMFSKFKKWSLIAIIPMNLLMLFFSFASDIFSISRTTKLYDVFLGIGDFLVLPTLILGVFAGVYKILPFAIHHLYNFIVGFLFGSLLLIVRLIDIDAWVKGIVGFFAFSAAMVLLIMCPAGVAWYYQLKRNTVQT